MNFVPPICVDTAAHANGTLLSGLTAAGVGNGARRTEPGWRAAVLDERESRHAFRLRTSEEGSGYRAPAAASGVSNTTRSERRRCSSASDDDGGGFKALRCASSSIKLRQIATTTEARSERSLRADEATDKARDARAALVKVRC